MPSSIYLQTSSFLSGEPSLLPSSKSISNRLLILNALSSNLSEINNLSSARDTRLMTELIGSPAALLNVMDAGTTMRFLTAYLGVTNQHKTLTGTDRMKQRPIALLVDALRKLGVSIKYLEQEGFPPIEIQGFRKQLIRELDIPGNVSSQYISALMMIAPLLPRGLSICLKNEIGSVPYIQMTARLMQMFGLEPEMDLVSGIINIQPGEYKPVKIKVESDWSAASYWYSFTALARESQINLSNITKDSLQGDREIIEIMDTIGVRSNFANNQLTLTRKPARKTLSWNFKDCPDLVQTVLPVCAVAGISGDFTGLESLRIKETDRIAALQNELQKVGAELIEKESGKWHLTPGDITGLNPIIHTYHDHRMAMGFAPWATLTDLTILDPDVVNKSYPGFWDDVKTVGIQTRFD